MGSNMQRQAVPLLKTESPIVGTGMEYKAGVDSGVCVLARKSGVVRSVSADEVTVTNDDGSVEILPYYEVLAFQPRYMYQSGACC